MSASDNALWQRCWREQVTAFHQKVTNTQLVRFWPSLELEPAARVFVPLCGKSLDMLWLAAQGHEVLGVELSPIATRAFFKENGLQPHRRKLGMFTLWQSDRIGILCGDYFNLTAAHLGDITAVFDRASLTALPQELRANYVRHLQVILPAAGKILLLTTEEPLAGETSYQSHAADEEIVALYVAAFDIQLSHVNSELEPNPDPAGAKMLRVEKKVYLLTPRLGMDAVRQE
jgi:thiopurine S-methyltransferase